MEQKRDSRVSPCMRMTTMSCLATRWFWEEKAQLSCKRHLQGRAGMAPETASLPRALYQLFLMLADKQQLVLPSLISQGCDTGQQRACKLQQCRMRMQQALRTSLSPAAF